MAKHKMRIVAGSVLATLVLGVGMAYANYSTTDGSSVTYVDDSHVAINGVVVSATLNDNGRLVPSQSAVSSGLISQTAMNNLNALPTQSSGGGGSYTNNTGMSAPVVSSTGQFLGYGNLWTDSNNMGHTYTNNGWVNNSSNYSGSASWVDSSNGSYQVVVPGSAPTSATYGGGSGYNPTPTYGGGGGGGSYTPPSNSGGGYSYTPPTVYYPPAPVYTPPPPSPPNTPSFTVNPNPAKDTDTLSFSKTETDPQGRGIIAEHWTVDGGAEQSSPPTSLSVGTHTITLQDENSAGLWSGTDSQQVNILPSVQAAISGAQLTDVVHPIQTPLNLPMNLPLSTPVSVHSGYNVTIHVASQGAGTIKMDLYSNGQSIPIGQGASVVNELSTSVPDGGSDITFFIPTSVANGSVIDVKFTLNCTDPKGYATSAVYSAPGTLKVSGSMYDDVLQNQTH